MSTGLYIGSFDPLTNGHMDIIERAAGLFDTLYIAVSNNSAKKYLIPAKYRAMLVTKAVQNNEKLNTFDFHRKHKVHVFFDPVENLTTTIMNANNIDVLVRSVRNSKDMEDEYILNGYYKNLKPDLEEIVLFSNMPTVSSTFVRECIKYRMPVKDYVPETVSRYLAEINNG